nr:SDR family NAD(P)-dependent oxidoreductase [Saccharopolyspora gloriosae]
MPRTIANVTEQDYDRLFAINTRAPFFVVQRGLERLRDGGRIVNISSAAAGRPGHPARRRRFDRGAHRAAARRRPTKRCRWSSSRTTRPSTTTWRPWCCPAPATTR